MRKRLSTKPYFIVRGFRRAPSLSWTQKAELPFQLHSTQKTSICPLKTERIGRLSSLVLFEIAPFQKENVTGSGKTKIAMGKMEDEMKMYFLPKIWNMSIHILTYLSFKFLYVFPKIVCRASWKSCPRRPSFRWRKAHPAPGRFNISESWGTDVLDTGLSTVSTVSTNPVFPRVFVAVLICFDFLNHVNWKMGSKNQKSAL